jgi:LPXTG-site transpeptidase (sortase) family protein
LLALLNPVFWFLTIAWFIGAAGFLQQIFPAPLYHIAMLCWIVGNFTIWYLTMLAARRSGQPSLVWAAFLVPVYWVMMSVAAVKAGWQMVAAPSHWEKTTHGLTDAVPVVAASGTDAAPRAAARVVEVTAAAPNGARQWSTIAAGLAPLDPSRVRLARAEQDARRAVALGRIGRRLAVAGCLLVAFVAYLVAGTGWRFERAQSELRVELAAASATRAPATGSAVARLRIPSIDVDVVVVEGASREALDRGPAHVSGSGLPGGSGPVIVVGHRSIAGAPFERLPDLRVGARVDVAAPWGAARYQVARVTTVGDLDRVRVPRRALALVTSGTGLGADHIVVRARLVGRPAEAPGRAVRAIELPKADSVAFPLLVAWALAAALAWRARRWLPLDWSPRLRAVLVLPVVGAAVLLAFGAAAHLLPATF